MSGFCCMKASACWRRKSMSPGLSLGRNTTTVFGFTSVSSAPGVQAADAKAQTNTKLRAFRNRRMAPPSPIVWMTMAAHLATPPGRAATYEPPEGGRPASGRSDVRIPAGTMRAW
jgi:hypothetical protein